MWQAEDHVVVYFSLYINRVLREDVRIVVIALCMSCVRVGVSHKEREQPRTVQVRMAKQNILLLSIGSVTCPS